MNPALERLAQLSPALATTIGSVGPVDCQLVAGDCHPTPGWEILACVSELARVQRNRYQLARAGCMALDLLQRRPWLHRVDLSIRCESEHDDEGGSVAVFNVRVLTVTHLHGVPLHEDLIDVQGAADVIAMEADVEQHFEFIESDFGAAFMDPDDTSEIHLQVDRERVSVLLTGASPASGAEAARLLWPNFQHLLATAHQP